MEKAAAASSRSFSFRAGLVAAYLTLNTVLNLTTKWILSSTTGYGFTFPLALTCCHMAIISVALLPHMLSRTLRSTHKDSILKQWKGLLAIGTLMAADAAFNNSSLVNMSLSLNQIIRASIPVFIAIAAVVIERRIPTLGESAGLLLLSGGAILALWDGTVVGSPYASFCCVTGTICHAAMLSFSGLLLSEHIDAVRLTFYTAPVSLALLLPIFLLQEVGRLYSYMAIHSHDVMVLVTMSSVLALLYNLAHSLMMLHTSAGARTVAGEAKVIGLLVLSYFILGEKKVYTFLLSMGCMMTVVGVCLFSHFWVESIKAKKSAELLRKAGSLDDVSKAEDKPLISAVTQHAGLSSRWQDSSV